jgi:septal ring factor EnvC (AmiA/AmiB activator)
MKGAFSRRRFRTRKCGQRESHSQFSETSRARTRERGRAGSPLIMQKFLSNLLIFFALSLCALCAFQWVRESHLRMEIADLHRTVYQKLESIQNLESQLKQTKEDVTRLDNLRAELSGIIKTNKAEIQNLTKYSEKLEKEIEAGKAQITVYKDAVDKANENIKRQNEDIKRQNDQMKQLAADRNGTVEKYNKVVEQYNDLVKQFEKFQEDAAKAAAPQNKGTEKK